MDSQDKTLKEITLKDLKPVALPFLTIVVVVLLFIFVGKNLLSKLSDKRDALKTSQKNEEILSDKISELNLFESGQNSSDVIQVLTYAIPAENSSLIILSQVKSEALANEVILSRIKVNMSGASENGLTKADVSFDIDGEVSKVISFLKALAKTSPLNKVNKLELNNYGGVYRASVTISTYYADFPKTVPEVTEPIKPLTEDELSLIHDLYLFKQPAFTTFVVDNTGGRENPFSI